MDNSYQVSKQAFSISLKTIMLSYGTGVLTYKVARAILKKAKKMANKVKPVSITIKAKEKKKYIELLEMNKVKYSITRFGKDFKLIISEGSLSKIEKKTNKRINKIFVKEESKKRLTELEKNIKKAQQFVPKVSISKTIPKGKTI